MYLQNPASLIHCRPAEPGFMTAGRPWPLAAIYIL